MLRISYALYKAPAQTLRSIPTPISSWSLSSGKALASQPLQPPFLEVPRAIDPVLLLLDQATRVIIVIIIIRAARQRRGDEGVELGPPGREDLGRDEGLTGPHERIILGARPLLPSAIGNRRVSDFGGCSSQPFLAFRGHHLVRHRNHTRTHLRPNPEGDAVGEELALAGDRFPGPARGPATRAVQAQALLEARGGRDWEVMMTVDGDWRLSLTPVVAGDS
jgi:hypothetical protein